MVEIPFELFSDSTLIYGTIEEGDCYIRITLAEPVNPVLPADNGDSSAETVRGVTAKVAGGLTPADNGSSGILKSKVKNIKYILMSVDQYFQHYELDDEAKKSLEHDTRKFLENCKIEKYVLKKPLALKKPDKSVLYIPPHNIISAYVGRSYSKRSFSWQSYKKKGKKIVKVFGIILGLILVITQIVINIRTISFS